MTTNNPPAKHHYTPQFLLAAWAVDGGKLWRFCRPHQDKIAKKRVAPAELGYQTHLYAAPGLPVGAAQWLETEFLSPLDSEASETHKLLIAGKGNGLSRKQRSAWSRFIMSQWFRTPEGVAAFKQAMAHLLSKPDPAVDAQYAARKKAGDPETFDAAVAKLNPDFAEQAALEIMRRMIDDQKNGLRLNNMKWLIRDIDGPRDLLVSDVLLQQNAAVFSSAGYIVMPIAPRKLFAAVNDQAQTDVIASLSDAELAGRLNKTLVRRASQYVGATDLSQQAFIEKHFGRDENGTLVKSLAAKYAAAAGSPAD